MRPKVNANCGIIYVILSPLKKLWYKLHIVANLLTYKTIKDSSEGLKSKGSFSFILATDVLGRGTLKDLWRCKSLMKRVALCHIRVPCLTRMGVEFQSSHVRVTDESRSPSGWPARSTGVTGCIHPSPISTSIEPGLDRAWPPSGSYTGPGCDTYICPDV